MHRRLKGIRPLRLVSVWLYPVENRRGAVGPFCLCAWRPRLRHIIQHRSNNQC